MTVQYNRIISAGSVVATLLGVTFLPGFALANASLQGSALNFSQVNSSIYDTGDSLHVTTRGSNLYLEAQDVSISNRLDVTGDVYAHYPIYAQGNQLNFGGGSWIRDNGSGTLTTKSVGNYYIQAPTVSLSRDLDITQNATIHGNLTVVGTLTATGFSGGGSATTSASDLTSGTLSDARLSSNVPLLDGTNTFTGNNVIGGTLQATGNFTALGIVGLANGTVGAPALAFTSDTDSGLYRIGANNIGVAVNGAKVLDVATTGLGVTGILTSSGALTVSAGGAGITGTTTINTSGSGVTTIGTGGTGAVNIGNATGNTAITGTLTSSGMLTVSSGGIAVTGGSIITGGLILNGSGSGSTDIGNSASTTSLVGTVNINASGSGTTNIAGGSGGNGQVNLGSPGGDIHVLGTFRLEGITDHSMTNSITASATHSVAGGTALTTEFNVVTSAGANDAVTLPTAHAGREVTIINRTGSTIDVWPDVTGNGINALGANAGYDVATLVEVRCVAVALTSSSATAWECQKLSR